MMRRELRGVAVFVLAAVPLAAMTLAGCAQPTGPTGALEPPRITARGVGTVTSKPDLLSVVIGVQTQGSSAQQALQANNELATSTIAALKGAGVADADLRTSQLSVSPTYDQNNGRISGYEVNNLVTATLRAIDQGDGERAGAVIDAAGAAAGDAIRVQQLRFSLADDSAPRAQARADAVRKAAGAGPAAGRGGGGDARTDPLDQRDGQQPAGAVRARCRRTARGRAHRARHPGAHVDVEIVYEIHPLTIRPGCGMVVWAGGACWGGGRERCGGAGCRCSG